MSYSSFRPQRLWRPLLLVMALAAGLFAAPVPAGATARAAAFAAVTFDVDANTAYGDTVLVSGGVAQLGSWNPAAAVPLSTNSTTYPRWTATVQLPLGATVQYKYLIRSASGTVTWEGVPDRTVSAPTVGTATTGDRWNTVNGATVGTVFHVNAATAYGQGVYVVGDIAELGGWNPAKAVSLSTDTGTYPTWTGSIPLPPNTAVQYKYLKKNPDGTLAWEGGANRAVVTPTGGLLTISDTWQ
ncbi:CBM20 domain-containing protein [Kitasatospora sp. NPDC059646]|uniref:CBM20 domain-containing protein n=1 Tax=Kitasatospora sp. NPDC059646 TaxID=3346893 RepID=UPI0036C26F13